MHRLRKVKFHFLSNVPKPAHESVHGPLICLIFSCISLYTTPQAFSFYSYIYFISLNIGDLIYLCTGRDESAVR